MTLREHKDEGWHSSPAASLSTRQASLVLKMQLSARGVRELARFGSSVLDALSLPGAQAGEQRIPAGNTPALLVSFQGTDSQDHTLTTGSRLAQTSNSEQPRVSRTAVEAH